MTGTESNNHWPDLSTLVAELRRIDQAAVADRLLGAVRAGATSGEILDAVGVVLREQRGLRSRLGEPGLRAWDAVMADVRRAYPGARLGHWFARLLRRVGRR